MRKTFLVAAILILFYREADCQKSIQLGIEATVVKPDMRIGLTDSGEVVSIDSIHLGIEHRHVFITRANGKGIDAVEEDLLNRVAFQSSDVGGYWKLASFTGKVYDEILSHGYEYEVRRSAEDEALEYMDNLSKENLVFNDSYLDDYLSSVLHKITPPQLKDGRPGVLNVRVVKDPTPNAFVFPNGMMVINTGLLTAINSEEELLAVMAHEVAHFELDHYIRNLHDAKSRKATAEFWATFATVLAGAADISIAANNKGYTPGLLTGAVAAISWGVASEIYNRLGLKFSREQESEADAAAAGYLRLIHVNPGALSSALAKIKSYCIQNGDYYALSGEGTHPAIDERILALGSPIPYDEIDYDKTISLVSSYNALLEFNERHLVQCNELVDRNIKSGVAVEDDYIVKAMTTMLLTNDQASDTACLAYLTKAESLKVSPDEVLYKQKGLVLLRLQRKQAARRAFDTYLKSLVEVYNNLNSIQDDKLQMENKKYLNGEISWTKKMIFKLGVM